MERLFTFFFLFSVLSSYVFGQADAASASNLTAVAYTGTAPVLTNYCLVTVTGQATTSCVTAPTDARWFQFTIPGPTSTNVVKITVVPTGFDAVIDFFSGPSGAPVFKECMNATGSGATEYLRTTYATNPVVPGTTYYFRVSATTDVAALCFNLALEYYPTAYNIYSPNPSPDSGTPGFKVTDNIKRNTPASLSSPTLVEATRFHIYNNSNLGVEVCTGDVTGSFDQKVLNTFSANCFCYGNNYTVYTEIKLDGVWGGNGIAKLLNMEAEPTVTITNSPCAVVNLSATLFTVYLGSSQQLQWEFTSGGQAPVTYTGAVGSNQLLLSNVPCLRYNRIYSVRVRIQYCGTWGPWSTPYCMITQPIPYLTLTGGCPQTKTQYGLLYCNYVVGVNQYIWQIAPVDPADPLIPIGPAVVKTTTQEVLGLASVPVTPGVCYRVAVKPKIISCGTPQEGDYGNFCTVCISGGGGMVIENEDEALQSLSIWDEPEYHYNESGSVGVFTYRGDRNNRVLTIQLGDTPNMGEGRLNIYSASGQSVYNTRIFTSEESPIAQTQLPSDLSDGIYIVTVSTSNGTYQDKFYVSSH